MPKYKMGSYYFPERTFKKYIRKNKHNRTYNGGLTVREAKKQATILLICIIAFIYGGIYQYIAVNPHSIHTQTSEILVSEKSVAGIVASRKEEASDPKSYASFPVMVEQQDIVKAEIIKQADKHSVNSQTALAIALCENDNLDPARKNPLPNSTATGIYQWVIGSWKHYSKRYWNDTTDYRKDYKKNIELAMLVMRDYGYKDWTASATCWKK